LTEHLQAELLFSRAVQELYTGQGATGISAGDRDARLPAI